EAMLADTSRLLSNITRQAAVVVSPPHEVATVRSVQLVGLSGRVVLLVTVLSNGAIHKSTLELDRDVDDDTIAGASERLAEHAVGSTLAGVGAVPSTGTAAVDALLEAAVGALGVHDREGDAVFV